MSNIMATLFGIFSRKCASCGNKVKYLVAAPASAGLKRKAKVCQSCSYEFQQGETALMVASSRCNLKLVQALLANGADVNAKNNKGDTALMAASHYGILELAKLRLAQALLANGADVNAKNKKGDTALMVASWYGNLDLAKLLLTNGADVNATSEDGTTALIQTSRRGASSELAKFLLSKGANPNVRYKGNGDNQYAIIKEGTTALLMWASFQNTRDVCQALLDKGADVNARDDQGKDALMLASKNGDHELIKVLRARGASGAAQAEVEAKRLKAEAEIAKAAEANAKRRRAQRAEAERIEAEAVAKGKLLPRSSEAVAAGKEIEGTFRAAGLTWQREPAPRAMVLRDAECYAAKLTLGGVEWRLPTVHELKALHKAMQSSPTLTDYPSKDDGWYWSASPYPSGNNFCVNFQDGSVAGNVNGKAIGVRCVVRDTAATEASLVTKRSKVPSLQPSKVAAAGEQSEGTFRAAGLTWQREPARWQMNWEDANSYAARLTLAGGGWRLPTLRELEALHKEKLSSSAIAAYPGMDQGWYWSASPSEDRPTDYIWGVDFCPKGIGAYGSSYGGGQVTGRGTNSTEEVRCVRV